MPRMVNVTQLKEHAKNPYVFSVIKTLCDEATSLGWEIKVKNEFQDEGDTYESKIKEVTKFFRNPNGNDESFEHILRQVITDILELDSGVIVKVFNRAGELRHIFSRDGGTFLKNPDIYGYMGDREDFVMPLPVGFAGIAVNFTGSPTSAQSQMMKQYDVLYKENAAYFQYGWTAGSMPIPFGKREIIYVMQNPRGDSVYGRSPVEILTEIILNLIYGADFNLDYYTNNNMPEGAIQLLGAQPAQVEQFRENFESQFKFTDSLGNNRKRFYSFPISTSEVKFTKFQLTSQEMEVISQQQWFTKVLWMCFGVNADEMGYTETSNRAVAAEQAKIFKRKAIKPLLNVLEYHLNSQLIPEFFATNGGMPDFCDVPLEFKFDTYDIEEDKKKHDLLEQQLNMGVKTPKMVAKELGINVEELEEEKEGVANGGDGLEEEDEIAISNDNKGSKVGEEDDRGDGEEAEEDMDKGKQEMKAKDDNPFKEIDEFIDGIGDALVQAVDKIPENEL